MFGCAIYGARGSRRRLSISGFRKTYIKKQGITFLTGIPYKTDVSLVFNKGVGGNMAGGFSVRRFSLIFADFEIQFINLLRFSLT